MALVYSHILTARAVAFLVENEDLVRECLVDGLDFDQEDRLDDALREATDLSLSMEDAVFVAQESRCLETDKGLWEGAEDLDQAYVIRSALSLSSDVGTVVRDLLQSMKDDFDEDENEDRNKAAEDAFSGVREVHAPSLVPIAKGSVEERDALREWFSLASKVRGWRNDYPLGSSYIDARCGLGFGMPEDFEYVEYDNELGLRLTHLAGKGASEVKDYVASAFPAPEILDADQVVARLVELGESRAVRDDFLDLARQAAELSHSPRP